MWVYSVMIMTIFVLIMIGISCNVNYTRRCSTATGPHAEGMVALTAVIGSISVITGLSAAYRFDTPTAPSIVCVSLGLFCVFSILGTLKYR